MMSKKNMGWPFYAAVLNNIFELGWDIYFIASPWHFVMRSNYIYAADAVDKHALMKNKD